MGQSACRWQHLDQSTGSETTLLESQVNVRARISPDGTAVATNPSQNENELAIDGELELDIREAPLRELLLRVPKGYALAKLTASGLSDYFLREPEGQPDAELRLVYGQPVTDVPTYITNEAQASLLVARRTNPQIKSGDELPSTVVIRADKSTPFTLLNQIIARL